VDRCEVLEAGGRLFFFFSFFLQHSLADSVGGGGVVVELFMALVVTEWRPRSPFQQTPSMITASHTMYRVGHFGPVDNPLVYDLDQPLQ